MSYERNDCRLCSSPVELVLSLEPTPIANLFPAAPNTGELYPLELKQCTRCGHVQIGHVVEDIALYGASYKYETPSALKPKFSERAKELKALYPEAETVLEIGSNNGLLLDELNSAGFKSVIGVDPSSHHGLTWKMNFTPETAQIILNRIGKKVDLVLANNVFAHVDNLHLMIAAVDKVLSYHGSLIFEVQYLIPTVEQGLFDMIYHEHRDYHTLTPLVRFLAKHSLVITDWEVMETHGGSLRVTAKREGVSPKFPAETIVWPSFQKRINEEGKRIRDSWTGKIAAFGAPAKASTLIHQWGLQNRISYVVDDTPSKQGKFIAGTSIPVVSRDRMMQDRPERMLLLSWNYEDIIRQTVNMDFIVPFKEEILAKYEAEAIYD